MASKLNKHVDHMFRAGQLSLKSLTRLKAQHGGVAPSKGAKTKGRMTAFESREGLRDQGHGKERGDRAVSRNQIDGPHQGMGKTAHGAGKPSGGGRDDYGGDVKSPRGATPSNREIDQKHHQKPDFPREGSRAGKGSASFKSPKLRAQAGTIAQSGPQYGGGGRNTQ